ncbi:unnamed protein product, partial [Effrenium voratum]
MAKLHASLLDGFQEAPVFGAPSSSSALSSFLFTGRKLGTRCRASFEFMDAEGNRSPDLAALGALPTAAPPAALVKAAEVSARYLQALGAKSEDLNKWAGDTSTGDAASSTSLLARRAKRAFHKGGLAARTGFSEGDYDEEKLHKGKSHEEHKHGDDDAAKWADEGEYDAAKLHDDKKHEENGEHEHGEDPTMKDPATHTEEEEYSPNKMAASEGEHKAEGEHAGDPAMAGVEHKVGEHKAEGEHAGDPAMAGVEHKEGEHKAEGEHAGDPAMAGVEHEGEHAGDPAMAGLEHKEGEHAAEGEHAGDPAMAALHKEKEGEHGEHEHEGKEGEHAEEGKEKKEDPLEDVIVDPDTGHILDGKSGEEIDPATGEMLEDGSYVDDATGVAVDPYKGRPGDRKGQRLEQRIYVCASGKRPPFHPRRAEGQNASTRMSAAPQKR